MKSGSHLLANSTWNAAAFVVGVGLNLIVLPFVVMRIGVASFGIAGLVMACIAPAVIFSTSLALMTTRELAQRLDAQEQGDAKRVFATALFLGLAAGIPLAVIFPLIGPAFSRRVFSLNGDLSGDLLMAFSFGAVGWLCQCVAGVFLALFTARQDYARLAIINISGTVVSTALMLVLIPRWPVASTFIGCQMAGFATTLLLSMLLSRLLLTGWLARPALHQGSMSSLLRIGKWQAVAQGGGLVAAQADRYLLGIFLLPQNVGYYAIAQRLEEAMYIGVIKIGEILFPFFSSLQGEHDKRVGDLFFRAAWVLNVLAVSVIGALIPVAGNVLHLWTGAEVAAEGQQVLMVLALAGILGSGANVFVFYLLANGRTRDTAIISLATALSTLGTGAIALPLVGWPAAGWSSCAGALAQIVVMTLMLRRSFDLPDIWRRVWHFVLMPICIGVACAVLLRVSIVAYGFEQNVIWWQVVGGYSVSAILIFTVVIAVSFVGAYGDVCRRDLFRIVMRIIPARSV